MDRNSKRAKIQAAREWLSQAEASLGKSDEVRSDLKLMMAKAELEGAAPGKHTRTLRKWLARGAALGLAALIALAIENWPSGAEGEQEMASEAVSLSAGESLPIGPEDSGPQPENGAAVMAGENEEEPEPSSVADVPRIVGDNRGREGTVEAGSPQAAVTPHMTYEPPRVPAPDKQRLMQEAGEVLRR